MGQRNRTAAVAATGALLLVAAPRPAATVAALTGSATDPTAPVVAAATLLAEALVAWLLLISAVTLVEQFPGGVGRAAGAVARRVAPRAVRRVVALTLGVTLAAGTVGATAASASPRAPQGRAAVALDWPQATRPPAAPPTLDWAAPAAAAPRAAATTSPETGDVVVARGDSLWSIAADHLPADADDAQIAQAWPAWWAANRDAIGGNPDLIHPGTHLQTPPTGTP